MAVDTNTFLFVIKPADYKFPSDDNNNHKFYRTNKAEIKNGQSPYAKKNKLSESVNFALIASPETENFKSIIFGDPQIETMDELSFLDRSIVSELEGIKNASFGISLGDIANETPAMYEPYLKTIKKIGIPWHNVFGNHDLDFRGKNRPYRKSNI